jgi:hypothetical protein
VVETFLCLDCGSGDPNFGIVCIFVALGGLVAAASAAVTVMVRVVVRRLRS